MTKVLTRFFCAFLFILFSSRAHSQIVGSFTVPGNYPSIAAAINTLNILGVSGPVTINVAAGYTETAVTGGYKLFNVSGASSTNQITFMKSGTGANPLIYAYTGGTCFPATSLQDGVWQLVGADYITIDGIDIYDPNTSNPSTMEYGYGLYPQNAGNGCQYNTIKNCSITLNRINSGAGGGLIIGGSRGIDIVSSSYTNASSALTATSVAGANSYNKFYSNSIQNCNIGISLMCSTPGSNAGDQNDIGGTSAATGNTITNFGGYSGNESSGIRTTGQISQSISYNTIINNNGSGSYPASNLHGIRTSNTGTNSVTNNSISLVGSPTGLYNLYGIHNDFATFNQINNNVFPSYSYTNTSSNPSLIYSQTSGPTTISGNIARNFISAGVARIFWFTSTNSCTANSNTITNAQGVGISLTGFNFTGPHITISNNLLDSVTNGITPYYGIDVTGASGTLAVISNNVLKNSTGTVFRGIRTALSIPFLTVSGNQVYNISNGTINGLGFIGLELMSSTPNGTVSANNIYSITSTGSGGTNNAFIVAMRLYGDQQVFQNRIGGLYSNGTNSVSGIHVNSGTQQIHNNLIGDMMATGSTQTCGVAGIYFDGYPSSAIYYNSVYLNSTSTGTNFGSTALMLANTNTLTVKNNIFVNTSVCTGTGITSAVRKVQGNTVVNVCNNNILYAGSPSTNHAIYSEVLAPANTFSILAAYKAYISPNESQSYTENPPFLSVNGNLANFLTVDPLIPTQIEGLASPISTYTFDYTNITRSSTAPDIGAREGNYTPADITPPVLNSSGFIGSICNASTGRTFTASLSDASGVGTGSLVPRLFYRVNLSPYSSAQGSLTAGTATNGVWTFSLTYSANPSDVIYYFLTMQDASAFSNFTIIPSFGSLGSDVNNIITPPSSASSFTVEGATVSLTGGTVCAGSNFTLVASGAASYTFSSGSAIVNPTTNVTYSVTGTSSVGCLSSNTAVATVSAMPVPTISVNSGSICSGQTFTIIPSGAISYIYAGGSALVSPSTSTSYTVAGTNSLGCISNTVIATVNAFTTPTVSAANGTICTGNNFTINPSGAASYSFSGGSAIVSPSGNAVYTVSGTSTAGCVSNTVSITVSVSTQPTISVNSGTICSGKSFTLTPSGAFSYTFSGGSAVVAPTTSTFYTVIGKNAIGCISSNTAVANVTVFATPVLAVNSGSICAGQTFTILPQGAASYTYAGGSAVVSPSSNTTYTVVGKSSIGCVSNTVAATVIVFANPTVSASGGSICVGNSFVINPVGAATFSISGGLPLVSPIANTSYSVYGTNTVGCVSNTVVLTVSVFPLPTVSVNSGSICAGVVFTIAPTGAATYFYSGGSATVSPAGTSSYSVSGISALGCPSSNTVVSAVTVFNLPVISVAGPTMVCNGVSFTLNASGAVTYTWSTGDTTPTISNTPTVNTIYFVTGMGLNGCSAKSSFTVAVDGCVGLDEKLIASGISIYPNPANGRLFVSIDQPESLIRIEIYNCLSQLVFGSSLETPVTEINLSKETKGIYFVNLFLGHNLIKTEKVIISD